MYQGFVATQGAEIEREARKLWPAKKPSEVKHWSGLNLEERVRLVGQPLEEAYKLYNRMLSWQVHSGGAGVMGVAKETFPHLCGMGYRISTLAFEEVIKSVAKELRLSLALSSLEEKMKFARYLPLTESVEQEAQLRKELGL